MFSSAQSPQKLFGTLAMGTEIDSRLMSIQAIGTLVDSRLIVYTGRRHSHVCLLAMGTLSPQRPSPPPAMGTND